MTAAGDILLPVAYFPPVSWFAYLIRGKAIFIEQMETYPKQTFRNRCEIITDAGKTSLVVPVSKPQGNHTLTRDMGICYREPWNRHHWKTLQSAYRSSPFFSYYADIIQPLFESQESLLIKHNQIILETLSGLIGIKSTVNFTTDFEKIPVNVLDLRSIISPKKTSANIEFPEYPQVFGYKYGFVPDLSLLDILFNLGPDTLSYLENSPVSVN